MIDSELITGNRVKSVRFGVGTVEVDRGEEDAGKHGLIRKHLGV